MQILQVTPGSPLAAQLADYAEGCGWAAGPHLADMLRQSRFTGWETAFAAITEGRIIGYCTFLQTDYSPENRYWPWISSIFVDEAWRGQHLSHRLIAAAEEYAREQGFRRTYIPSDMVGFYEKCGYAPIDRLLNYGGGTDAIFCKEL